MTSTDQLSGRKLRVLIADDAQETRRTTRVMLSMNPLVEVVAMAKDGREAVELAQKHKPDIAIMDINMPQINGFAAYRVISQIHPDMGCIIISTEKDDEAFRTAMSVGAREYLIKPFTIDELNTAVNQVGARVREKYKQRASTDDLRQQRELYLKRLAQEYTKSRRTDDKALEVFERLAANPECELRWLRTLAIIYVIRQEWGKLKALAIRLESQVSKTPPFVT
jgi:YesN/AraC family two-component response regulator